MDDIEQATAAPGEKRNFGAPVIRPGDTVIVETENVSTAEEADELKAMIREAIGDVKVVILVGGHIGAVYRDA